MASAGNLLYASGLTSYAVPNGRIVASVAGGALTIALKHADGTTDPSPTRPLYVASRSDPTSGELMEGKYITTPVAMVVSAGSTLGTVNDIPFRLWLKLIDDDGVWRLGVINCFNGTTIFPLPEFANTSAIADAGVGAADLAGFVYANAAVTDKPFRLAGFLDWTSGLAAAGTWSAEPDEKQMFGMGMPTPGDVIQEEVSTSDILTAGTTAIPYDDTIPQDSECKSFNAPVITPTSKINVIENQCEVNVSYSVASPLVLALFLSGTASALSLSWGYSPAADIPVNLRHIERRQANTLSLLTFIWALGGTTSGTPTINGLVAGRKFGGGLKTFRRIAEIMV